MSGSPREEAYTLAEACRPNGEVNALLLERYLTLIDWDAPATQAEWELEFARLRALLAALEATGLDAVSHSSLDRLNDIEDTEPADGVARRRAVERLRRDLQAWGELPSAKARLAARAVDRFVSTLESSSAAIFEGWLARRGEQLSPHQLAAEARHLVVLEQLAAAKPDLDAEALLMLWKSRITRKVVDCPCPPVTRSWSPLHCERHPAYPLRSSPGPRKQRELASAGKRYLAFRSENE